MAVLNLQLLVKISDCNKTSCYPLQAHRHLFMKFCSLGWRLWLTTTLLPACMAIQAEGCCLPTSAPLREGIRWVWLPGNTLLWVICRLGGAGSQRDVARVGQSHCASAASGLAMLGEGSTQARWCPSVHYPRRGPNKGTLVAVPPVLAPAKTTQSFCICLLCLLIC